ncbi:hypothetical protein GCD22_00916 [Acidithiobacillus thiooxidans ATCC 19377]|uniref:Uncharacterized protein n=1 Tax=Acidithiobacillus thiooxidans ATCC 19377 TaxID=637390 RepID=A0A5P9XNT9_ACITH|nr:hypothetical protein GCD22_00916 [Acidithiobacillus thiooxidans ATCC 19377]
MKMGADELAGGITCPVIYVLSVQNPDDTFCTMGWKKNVCEELVATIGTPSTFFLPPVADPQLSRDPPFFILR